jgi:hypothetical protein
VIVPPGTIVVPVLSPGMLDIHTLDWGTGVTRKWQWMFVNGSENKRLNYAATELVTCAKMGATVHISTDIKVRNVISVE